MKRLNNAFSDIVDFANLRRAAHDARKGKKQQPVVQTFFFHLEFELLDIKSELLSKSYTPGKFHFFTVRDPKVRKISAAPFRDRVVHHALCNVLEPWCERFYIFDSYACRKGKGQHSALQRAQKFARGNRYFLKFDIRKFFESIAPSVLQNILRKKIKDRDMLWLLDKIIEHRPHDIGLPIGNLTSQHFANIYLNELDHYIKSKLRCKHYIRYMDDAVVYANNKRELWETKMCIADFLHEELRLQINEKSTFLRPISQEYHF